MLKDLLDYIMLKFFHYKGIMALVKGRYVKAYHWMQKVLMISNTPEYQYDMGIILLSLYKYEEAVDYLHKVLIAVPDNEIALLAYAQSQSMLRHWEEATESFTHLAAQHPTNLSYQRYLELVRNSIKREKNICARELVNLAQTEVEKGQLNEALTHLREAEAFDPQNPQIPNNIGAILISLKRSNEEILDHFEKALSLDPENEKIKRNIVYFRHKMKI